MSWLKAMNPGAPINGEAEAKKAARSSAVSIFIGVIVAWPLVETIRLSFTNADLGGEEWVGLANYEKLLSSAKFYDIVGRTFFWMVLSVALKLVLGLIGATLHQQDQRTAPVPQVFGGGDDVGEGEGGPHQEGQTGEEEQRAFHDDFRFFRGHLEFKAGCRAEARPTARARRRRAPCRA